MKHQEAINALADAFRSASGADDLFADTKNVSRLDLSAIFEEMAQRGYTIGTPFKAPGRAAGCVTWHLLITTPKIPHFVSVILSFDIPQNAT